MLLLMKKKRGVLIGIAKTFNWNGKFVFEDGDGQILIFKGQLAGMLWTLVGTYVPHVAKENFFGFLIQQIDQHTEGNLILMGNYNCVMNKEIDVQENHCPFRIFTSIE